MTASFQETYRKIPPAIRTFLTRAIIAIAVWQIAYHGFLEQPRLLDKPLTEFTAMMTAKALTVFYAPSEHINGEHDSTILVKGVPTVRIADGCNALELYVIYLGFIFCMPAKRGRMWLFALGGTAAILLLNIFRCYSIAWLHIHHPSWVDFAHHYLFYFVVYGFIFFLWTRYCRRLLTANGSSKQYAAQ